METNTVFALVTWKDYSIHGLYNNPVELIPFGISIIHYYTLLAYCDSYSSSSTENFMCVFFALCGFIFTT